MTARRPGRLCRGAPRGLARRGFTLWEMALVLLVLGIAAGLAVPAFARLGAEQGSPDATQELLQLLRSARRAAVAHGVTVTLVVDPGSGRYVADSAGVEGVGALSEGTLALGRAGALQTDLPRLRYAFRATGAALADSVLVRAAAGAALVTVDPWSGEARAEPR